MAVFARAAIALLVALSGGDHRRSRSTIAIANAAQVLAEDGEQQNQLLTFFDQDFFEGPIDVEDAARKPGDKKKDKLQSAKGGNKQQQQDESESGSQANNTTNNTLLYSHSIIGFALSNETTFESSNPTPSPTPIALHPFHGIPLPSHCERQIALHSKGYDELSSWCQSWIDKNPEFSWPTASPSGSPTDRFELVESATNSVQVVATIGKDDDDDADPAGLVMNMVGNATTSDSTHDSDLNTTTNTSTDTDTTANTTITTTTLVFHLTPTDDTFLESFRPREPLGHKSNLKIDADTDGVPTKIIQIKFGLEGIFGSVLQQLEDLMNETTTTTGSGEDGGVGNVVEGTVELTGATLQLYALADTTFGGYISDIISRGEEDDEDEQVEWTEDAAVWRDYVRGGRQEEKALALLPGNDRMIGKFGESISSENWYSADVTSKLMDMFASSNNDNSTNSTEDDKLALRISTDSTDGVVYASKEHSSGNGPRLELSFVLVTTTTMVTPAAAAAVDTDGTAAGDASSLNTGNSNETEFDGWVIDNGPDMNNNATNTTPADLLASAFDILDTAQPTRTPTAAPTVSPLAHPTTQSPSKAPTSSPSQRPTASPQESIVVAEADLVEASSTVTTSVVSSSFRMTITAIETATRRKLSLLRGASVAPGRYGETRRQLNGVNGPTIEEKERPAIIDHLTRVYADVLSIAPQSISLVFEEDLEVEEMSSGRNFNGVVRSTVFRVMAIFDDPDVSTLTAADAAGVLDQATIYAFVGVEELEFIKILKSTGAVPIVDGPAEYDVTVLKVNYSGGIGASGIGNGSLQGGATASTTNNAANGDTTGQDKSSSSSFPLETALIAGASILVFASSAAALILWKQRRRLDSHDGGHNKPDSPRSLETFPATPSPAVFQNRFKNKKKFDYAEFDDEDDIEKDGSNDGAACDAVISPLTINKTDFAAANPRMTAPVNTRQPTNVKIPQYPNISFDDSSVSDVSANILGARGALKHVDANTASVDDPNVSRAESFLLDTTMESYNMEAMSALDQVRFEDVLQVSTDGALPSYHAAGGIMNNNNVTSNIYEDDGSVPSELYSNLSIDSSMLHMSQDQSGIAGQALYGAHLFTSMDLMMLKNKDSSLMDMPPPPSDAASDSSSRPDDALVGDSDDQLLAEQSRTASPVPTSTNLSVPASIGNAPMRDQSEQNAVSQSINEELKKVMNLLTGDDNNCDVAKEVDGDDRSEEEHSGVVSRESTVPFNVDASIMHIGNVKVIGETSKKDAVTKEDVLASGANTNPYDNGLNVLMDDISTDAEPEETDPVKQATYALNDCIDILEKAKLNQTSKVSPYANNNDDEYGAGDEDAAVVAEKESSSGEADEDESSLVTERLD